VEAALPCVYDRLRPTPGRPKLSKRVYLHLRWNEPAPLELLRWNLVERFGWTLGEVDALSFEDLREFLQVEDGRAKAKE